MVSSNLMSVMMAHSARKTNQKLTLTSVSLEMMANKSLVKIINWPIIPKHGCCVWAQSSTVEGWRVTVLEKLHVTGTSKTKRQAHKSADLHAQPHRFASQIYWNNTEHTKKSKGERRASLSGKIDHCNCALVTRIWRIFLYKNGPSL